PASLMAQNRVVKGKVTDENGAPLASVNVLVKGSSSGTQTDKNGNFSINLPGTTGKVDLVISYTGYKPLIISADEKQEVSVRMAPDAAVLDEVVVGYQVVKRRDLTASV